MVDCGERIFGDPIAQAYIHSYDNPECAGEPTWYEQKCCTESEAPHAACSIECHNDVSDHHDNDDHDDNAAVWLIVTLLIILVVLCFCGILVCICVGVWRLNAKNRRPHLQAPVGNPSGGYQMRRIVLPPVDSARPVGGAHCQACGRKYNGGTAPPKYCASCGAQVVARVRLRIFSCEGLLVPEEGGGYFRCAIHDQVLVLIARTQSVRQRRLRIGGRPSLWASSVDREHHH